METYELFHGSNRANDLVIISVENRSRLERDQSKNQHRAEDLLRLDVRGQNDLAVRRVDMELVDIGHAFVIHGCC